MVSPKNSRVACVVMGFYSLRSLEFRRLVIGTRYPALMARVARLLLALLLLLGIPRLWGFRLLPRGSCTRGVVLSHLSS